MATCTCACRASFILAVKKVLGLSRKCGPPTQTGFRNLRRLRKGLHPDKRGASVDIDEFIPLL
eukprot:2590661-Pyramimonas_sp.AAC.1